MEKYGFVYIWYDRKHKRFYVGCHWGTEDDGYICSSKWMLKAYKRRSDDFKKSDGRLNRRILTRVYSNRKDLLEEEYRWLLMIKDNEFKKRYYNISRGCTNGTKTEKHRKSISCGRKGMKFSDEHKANITKAERERRKLEKEAGFRYSFYDDFEWRENIRKRVTGVKFSNERKRKISEAIKNSPYTQVKQERITILAANKIKESRWYNDGLKNYRLKPSDELCKTLKLGRVGYCRKSV